LLTHLAVPLGADLHFVFCVRGVKGKEQCTRCCSTVHTLEQDAVLPYWCISLAGVPARREGRAAEVLLCTAAAALLCSLQHCTKQR
jgi:hypothetical protein